MVGRSGVRCNNSLGAASAITGGRCSGSQAPLPVSVVFPIIFSDLKGTKSGDGRAKP